MGKRYAVQRSNRVRLKADVAVLLTEIRDADRDDLELSDFRPQIVEMLARLHPPTGARVDPVLTDYTNPKKEKKRGR